MALIIYHTRFIINKMANGRQPFDGAVAEK